MRTARWHDPNLRVIGVISALAATLAVLTPSVLAAPPTGPSDCGARGIRATLVVLRIPETTEQLPVSEPTVATAIGQLERIGILRELTGRPRNKVFAYDEYLKILSEGTEPL